MKKRKLHSISKSKYSSVFRRIAVCVVGIGLIVIGLQQRTFTKASYYKKRVFVLPDDVHMRALSSRAPVNVPILLYHYVEYVKDKRDTIRQSLDIVPKILEEQVQTLLSDSYTPITINDLADYLDGKILLPPKPVILTFDDGY